MGGGGWGVITRIKANLSLTELGLTSKMELSLAKINLSSSSSSKSESTNFVRPYQPGGWVSEFWTMSKISYF